jgi:lysophospholipase L1-like esterase
MTEIILDKIQIKRGLKANAPTLDPGEPYLCEDTEEIAYGTLNNGNIFAKISDLSELDSISQNVAANTSSLAEKVSKVNGQSPDGNGNVTIDVGSDNSISSFYKQSKSGKKIVMVGDSTTEVAPAMYDRFAEYVKTGGLLDGATIVNRGSNGNQLWQFISGIAQNANTLNVTLADNPDIYVVSYGINDIRAGVSSAGRTKAQVKTDLKTLIDTYLNQTNAYILLRTPNTFIQDSNASTYFDDATKAQLYSDQLYEIYESFRGYDKRVDVIDIPNKVFGKKVLPFHPYMLNTLHPNDNGYRAICDEITEHITNVNKDTKLNTDDLIMKGTIESATTSTLVIATSSKEEISIGDIVLLGNGNSFVVQSQPKFLGSKWRITHNNVDYSKYGVIRVIRKQNKKGIKTTASPLTNDWIRATFTGSNIGYLQYVIDLQALALTGVSEFNLDFKYYTENTNIDNVTIDPWLNNNPSPSAITGGIEANSVPASFINLSETNKLGFTFNINTQGYRYLHLLIVTYRKDSNILVAELGEFNLLINGINIDLSVLNPTLYNPNTASILEKNIAQRDVYAMKKYVDELPRKSGISSLINNWYHGKNNKTNATPIYNRFVIDISSYAITTTQDFNIKFKYFAPDNRVTLITAEFWLNNSPSAITGGISGSTTPQSPTFNSEIQYDSKVSLNPNTYQYVHLLVEFSTNIGQGITYEFGELELTIGSQVISLSGITPTLYNQEAGSVLLTNAYKGNAYMLYRDFISELRRLGILTS